MCYNINSNFSSVLHAYYCKHILYLSTNISAITALLYFLYYIYFFVWSLGLKHHGLKI